MILLLAIVLIALAAWVVFKPTWLPKAPENRVTDSIAQGMDSASSVSSSLWDRVASLWRRGNKKLAQQFKVWASEAVPAKKTQFYKSLSEEAAEFSAWLETLSDQELNAFVQKVDSFCNRLDFELNWLVDPKLNNGLKQPLEETVILYSLTTWKAREAQALARYVAWQSAPDKKQNRDFAKQLYAKLMDRGLVSPSPNVLLASEKDRQAHMNQAIRETADTKHKEFVTIVQELAAEMATGKEKRAAQAQSAPASSDAVEVAA